MARTKLTSEQLELIALIPKAIRDSKDYTDSSKLVLGQLDLMDGSDFSKLNHYVFIPDDELMKETGIKSKHTVYEAIKKLSNEGLIVIQQRGYRVTGETKASEYYLTDKYYELGGRKNPHKDRCNKGCNKGCNNENDLKLQIDDMQQQINELYQQIEELKNALKKINCTSDTDTETDTCTNNPDCSGTCTREINDKNKTTMELNEYYEQYRKQNEVLFEQSDDFDPSEHSDIAEMVRLDAGVHRNEPSDFDYINAWVTKKYDRLRSLIQLMRDTWDEQSIKNYSDEILSIFDKVHEHYLNGWFTEKQADAFQSFINNYNSIVEGRNNYFNGKSTKKATVTNAKETTSEVNDTNTPISSDVISESGQDGGCAPAAPKPTKKKYSSFDDFDVEEWKKHVKSGGLDEQFNKPAKTHKRITMAEVYAGQSNEQPTVEEPEIPYGQAK